MARAPAVQESEELPQADRLEDFPHPRQTRVLFGHAAAEQGLAEAFASGRMHHGWLLAGPEGIGKATLAYRLARHVLARTGERSLLGPGLEVPAESSAARQVAALSHPGLLVLRRPYDAKSKRFAASIPIDEVRRLKSFLGLTAAEGTWRVVVVDSADDLNPNAANALLKSLEEPPTRALFVLVSSQPSRLLATLRSRCRRLDLAPLQFADVQRAANAALAATQTDVPTPADWASLERLAQGRVRRALQLWAGNGLELHERILSAFIELPKVDWGGVHTLADQLALATQEQRFEMFFDLFLAVLARLVRARTLGHGVPAEQALAARLIPAGKLAEWAGLWDAVLAEKVATETLNLDRKALIMNTFARLEAVAATP
jgi:DNA polymerase III subunit delta'